MNATWTSINSPQKSISKTVVIELTYIERKLSLVRVPQLEKCRVNLEIFPGKTSPHL
jgi:hypothetical protein